jgi:hypothetical protein
MPEGAGRRRYIVNNILLPGMKLYPICLFISLLYLSSGKCAQMADCCAALPVFLPLIAYSQA